MKTGIEIIAQERIEQVEKHCFTYRTYDQYYIKNELVSAAIFCATLDDKYWPVEWDDCIKDKIKSKTYQERIAVMGAFCAAEIDRINEVEL